MTKCSHMICKAIYPLTMDEVTIQDTSPLDNMMGGSCIILLTNIQKFKQSALIHTEKCLCNLHAFSVLPFDIMLLY